MNTARITIHAETVKVQEKKTDASGNTESKDSFASVFSFKTSANSSDSVKGAPVRKLKAGSARASKVQSKDTGDTDVSQSTAGNDKDPTVSTVNASNNAVKAQNPVNDKKTDMKDSPVKADSVMDAGDEALEDLKEDVTKEDPVISSIMDLLLQMTNEIADYLGIDLSNVKDYIEANKLSFSDLPDINNWKLLVVKADGLEGTAQLLTSDKAFTDFSEVSNIIDNMKNSDDMGQLVTGLTDGTNTAKELLADMSEAFTQTDKLVEKFENFVDKLHAALSADIAAKAANYGKADDEITDAVNNDITPGDSVTTAVNEVNDVVTESDSKHSEQGKSDYNGKQNDSTQFAMTSDAVVKEEAPVEETTAATVTEEDTTAPAADENKEQNATDPVMQPEKTAVRSSERSRTNAHQVAFAVQNNTVFGKVAESVANLEKTNSLPEGVKASDILDQVNEQIRTLRSPERTSLEMTLHPESLGKVSISVSSHQGELQAVLRVENPAARDALTSQISDLKLQFENQGIKVDNVDVMLSNEGLNQNNSGQNADDGRGDRHRHRNFRSDEDIVTELDSQSDEEALSGVRAVTGAGTNVDATA